MLTEYDPLRGILVVLIPLNRDVKECVVPNADDTFTVFLNENISDERRLEAYKHALKHILNNDFGKTDVQSIEQDAHTGEGTCQS